MMPKFKRGDMVLYNGGGPAYLVVNVIPGNVIPGPEARYDLASPAGGINGVAEHDVSKAEGDQRSGWLPPWAEKLQAEAMREPWLKRQ